MENHWRNFTGTCSRVPKLKCHPTGGVSRAECVAFLQFSFGWCTTKTIREEDKKATVPTLICNLQKIFLHFTTLWLNFWSTNWSPAITYHSQIDLFPHKTYKLNATIHGETQNKFYVLSRDSRRRNWLQLEEEEEIVEKISRRLCD